MKQKLFILIALVSISLYANAQEYRLAKSSGQLKLNITSVIVEGYDGKDIIFSGQKIQTEEVDERAKGLVPISSSKYTDNTGLGISVIENGQDVNVNLVSKKPIGVLTIKVPNNIKVSIINNGTSNGFLLSSSNSSTVTGKASDEILLKNLKSEIEVSVYWNKIRLENNTGPMSIKTVSGSVEAIFSGEIKGPVSIISVTNFVDVTLPASTKANIEMGTSFGKLYAGKEFKIDLDKIETVKANTGFTYGLSTTSGNGTAVGGQQIEGNLTGVNAQGQNRLAARSTKSKDTATTITSVNGQKVEVLKGATVQNRSTGSIVSLNDGTSINSIQMNGDNVGVSYAISTNFYGGERIKGKLNGGGIDLIFKSTNKNVYLRQQ